MAQDQRVEFLFAAQVTGQNQLEKLTQTVDKLRQETEQLKNANTTLASSTDAVIRNGVRYNNALDAQSRSLRQARQGTQQLGMQINDFFTSVSTGASITQAFNQQIGQVGYAMSMMEGRLGKVGAFLAGPWGAAITIGAMALAPMIDQLGKLIFNTEKAESALVSLVNKQRQAAKENLSIVQAEIELNKLRDERTRLEFLRPVAFRERGPQGLTRSEIDKRKRANAFAIAEAEAAIAAQRELERKIPSPMKADGGSARSSGGGGSAVNKAAKLQEDLQKRLAEAEFKKQADNLSAFQRFMDSVLGKSLPEYESKLRDAYALQSALTGPEQIENAAKFAQGLDAIDAKRIAEDFAALNLVDGVLPQLADTLGKVTPLQDAIVTRNEELQSSFEAVGNTVSEAFKGMLTGAMSWKEGVKSLIASVINELWRLFVVQQIVGFVQKAMGSITGTPIPGKAIGGTVAKNQPYIVGERGPELFIPGGSGTIIPNRNLGGGKSGNSFNINVDARGSADPAAVRAQVQQGILEAAPAIIAAAEARTVGGLRRPRLGGVIQ